MRKYAKYHQDVILLVAALVMVGGIAGYALWSMSAALTAANASFSVSPPGEEKLDIDIAGAQKILRGRGLGE